MTPTTIPAVKENSASDSSSGPVKVPAWKAALKVRDPGVYSLALQFKPPRQAAAAGRAAGQSAVADVLAAASPTAVPSWKTAVSRTSSSL